MKRLLLSRTTGLRIGELVDLELDCVHEVPGQGAWLKVLLGKLATERMVPLDDHALAIVDRIAAARSPGRPLPQGRGDRTYPFRAHSEYLYLADRERSGGTLAYSPVDGWVEFVAPVTADELLWSGLEGDREGIPDGTRPLDELEAWVAGRPVRRLGATADADVELRDALIHVRRPKDDIELDRMRTAEQATRAGSQALAQLVAAGRTERELPRESRRRTIAVASTASTSGAVRRSRCRPGDGRPWVRLRWDRIARRGCRRTRGRRRREGLPPVRRTA